MIPKKVHFIWFGEKMPQRLKDVSDDWRRKMPDYEFIKWDEKNSKNYLENKFVQKALKDGKYAFVSDYIRLKVLYEFGGVYLDTDMVITQKLDKFLKFKTFWGRMYSNAIGTSIIGSEPGNEIIKKILSIYEKEDISLEESNNRLITKFFIDEFTEFDKKNIKQILGKSNLLMPINCFYLPSYKKSRNCYSYHLFINSWTNSDRNSLKNQLINHSPMWLVSYIRNRNGCQRFNEAIYKE